MSCWSDNLYEKDCDFHLKSYSFDERRLFYVLLHIKQIARIAFWTKHARFIAYLYSGQKKTHLEHPNDCHLFIFLLYMIYFVKKIVDYNWYNIHMLLFYMLQDHRGRINF